MKLLKVLSVSALLVGFAAFADETTTEKVDTTLNKAGDAAKEGVRNAQDAGCETINGKVECAGQKLKHKSKTAWDKTKTKAKEIKNKVD